jgi:hypothetical protein
LCGRGLWQFRPHGAPTHRAGWTLTALSRVCMCSPDGPESVRYESDRDGPECGQGRIRRGTGCGRTMRSWRLCRWCGGNRSMSATTRLVARFKRRLEMAVDVRGSTICQLQSSHMPSRPHGVWEGEIPLFTPEDDLQLRDRVQGGGTRLEELIGGSGVHLPPHGDGAQNALRLPGSTGTERAGEAAGAGLHQRRSTSGRGAAGGFPAETGEDAVLALVRARDQESSDDDDAPRYTPAQPGFPAFSSSRVAELRTPGDRRPLRRLCEPFAGTGSASNSMTRTSGPSPGPTHHRARGGCPHRKSSFDVRGRRRPSVVGQARPN